MVSASQHEAFEAAMILVYGDDSADEKKQRVSAVAVVFGSGRAWRWLEPKWKARNKGIPFHAKNCESNYGDYKKRSNDANKKLYRELVTLLAGSEIGGLGIAFDLAVQRRLFPQSFDLAYHTAFMMILERILIPAVHFNQPTKFTFDIGTENEYNAALIYSNFRENNPNATRLFRKIEFAHAKESARLQVADLIAFECMKWVDNNTGPVKRTVRKSWLALEAAERFGLLPFGEEWFRGQKADLPNAERKHGFNYSDYAKWLVRKRRHHNKTNIIEFADSMVKRTLRRT